MAGQHDQVLTMRETPLFIDTAHGLIEIRRVPGDRRSLRFAMPAGLRVHVGQKQIETRSPWLDVDNGTVRPKHKLLQTVDRADGFQLRPAPPLQIAKPKE